MSCAWRRRCERSRGMVLPTRCEQGGRGRLEVIRSGIREKFRLGRSSISRNRAPTAPSFGVGSTKSRSSHRRSRRRAPEQVCRRQERQVAGRPQAVSRGSHRRDGRRWSRIKAASPWAKRPERSSNTRPRSRSAGSVPRDLTLQWTIGADCRAAADANPRKKMKKSWQASLSRRAGCGWATVSLRAIAKTVAISQGACSFPVRLHNAPRPG
jgi:hypothetical protein